MTDQPSKVVPVEPTEAMLLSGCSIPGVSLETGRRMWRAMLAAAPHGEAQTPAPQGGGEALREVVSALEATLARPACEYLRIERKGAQVLLAALKPQTPDVLGEVTIPRETFERMKALADKISRQGEHHTEVGVHGDEAVWGMVEEPCDLAAIILDEVQS